MKAGVLIFSVLLASVSSISLYAKQPTKPNTATAIPTIHTQIDGYLGARIEDCVRERVLTEQPDLLIEPFRNRTETHRWQSEFWGKWMLGAVASYQYQPNPELLTKMSEAVTGLLTTQTPDGYIGNYAPESQLKQWDVWRRKYTTLGLIGYYDITGDRKALEGARKVADHLMTQVGPGKTDIVTTGNYHGMASSSVLEPIVKLYVRTGEKKYLDFATYIVSQWETAAGPDLIGNALKGVPVSERYPVSSISEWESNGQKAYEMMSCYEGLLELYKITGNPDYLKAVELTVQNIIRDEINIAGSGAAFECFYQGGRRQTDPAYYTMETCVTMTWMKLCSKLLDITHNSAYADQIEKTIYNAMLASLKNDASDISKYSPLEGCRVAGGAQCGMHLHCCNANGPRAFALVPTVALNNCDDCLYVNLYAPARSETVIKKVPVEVLINTSYPEEGNITLTVNTERTNEFDIALRIPAWSEQTSVQINGETVENISPGTYLNLNRQWEKGDRIDIGFDMRGRLCQLNGHQAILRGPVVLARDSRFGDGFVDEMSVIRRQNNYVELTPLAQKPDNIWMAFSVAAITGSYLEGPTSVVRQISLCDFASAGNTWDQTTRYKVWLKETVNVTETDLK